MTGKGKGDVVVFWITVRADMGSGHYEKLKVKVWSGDTIYKYTWP